ncbi:MAG: polysaccharide biosynthesis protein [Sphingomonadaceae bacterium]
MKQNRTINYILGLPRVTKRLIALLFDAIVCASSVYLAFYLRIGEWMPIGRGPGYPMLVSVALALPIFVSFGLYRAIFRYAGWAAVVTIARAVLVYALPFATLYTVIGIQGVPRTIGMIQPILLFLMIGSSRTFARVILGETYKAAFDALSVPRVLIYGAGSAGRQLASGLRSSNEMRLLGFVDDDPALWRATMNGLPVYNPADLQRVTARKDITDILLAVPSASRTRRREILQQLKHLGLHVRTLPGLLDIARGSVSVSDLKDLEIEDLLGRAPVPPDETLLRQNVEGKTLLVTGAGGSIGGELCRQILARKPALLLLLDSSEYNLYTVHQELSRVSTALNGDAATLVPLLGSVCDKRRIEEIVGKWQPDAIYHAAAYKHVPIVEHNAIEGISNNVFGTLNVASIARDHGVASFVLISTDKAVRPTNIMGTSKRLAEMILQAMAADNTGATRFSMVRFGNVLGSSGSVVPLFRNQIAKGGPVTITHPDMTRYFMTIPEAAQLVLQSGTMAVGGDVFLLDMGEPVKIIDLARNMVELSGLTVRDSGNPQGDIEICTVGLRPGEKLYEELLIGDAVAPTTHPRIMRSNEQFLQWPILSAYLEKLADAVRSGDARSARILLRKIVPEYQPTVALVDHISAEPSRLAS